MRVTPIEPTQKVRNSKKKFKKYTKEERKKLGLDKFPETMYGNATERDPRILEEAPMNHDPRGRRFDV